MKNSWLPIFSEQPDQQRQMSQIKYLADPSQQTTLDWLDSGRERALSSTELEGTDRTEYLKERRFSLSLSFAVFLIFHSKVRKMNDIYLLSQSASQPGTLWDENNNHLDIHLTTTNTTTNNNNNNIGNQNYANCNLYHSDHFQCDSNDAINQNEHPNSLKRRHFVAKWRKSALKWRHCTVKWHRSLAILLESSNISIAKWNGQTADESIIESCETSATAPDHHHRHDKDINGRDNGNNAYGAETSARYDGAETSAQEDGAETSAREDGAETSTQEYGAETSAQEECAETDIEVSSQDAELSKLIENSFFLPKHLTQPRRSRSLFCVIGEDKCGSDKSDSDKSGTDKYGSDKSYYDKSDYDNSDKSGAHLSSPFSALKSAASLPSIPKSLSLGKRATFERTENSVNVQSGEIKGRTRYLSDSDRSVLSAFADRPSNSSHSQEMGQQNSSCHKNVHKRFHHTPLPHESSIYPLVVDSGCSGHYQELFHPSFRANGCSHFNEQAFRHSTPSFLSVSPSCLSDHPPITLKRVPLIGPVNSETDSRKSRHF